MTKNYFLPILKIGFAMLSVASCDSETIDVGAEVLTNTSISQFQLEDNAVSSQQVSLNRVQTNNYNGNRFLGTSQSVASGETNYGLLCRINPTESTALTDTIAGQTIQSIKIKSAELIWPYNYELVETTGDSLSTYRIIGGQIMEGQELNLEVFKSNHQIITSSSATNTRQPYFANASTLNAAGQLVSVAEELEAGGDILENIIDNVPAAEEFEIQVARRNDDNQIVSIARDSVSTAFEREGRSLRLQLNPDFLGDTFADANRVITDPSLFTTSAFYENFKGIYLKPANGNATLLELNPNFLFVSPKVKITFEINATIEETTGEGDAKVTTTREEITDETLDFDVENSLLITTISASNSATFDTAVATDENIILKSGVSASLISIFQEEDLAIDIFEQNPIINQATLRLYVDVNSPLYNVENIPQFLWLNFLQTGNLFSGAELQEGEVPFYEFSITQYMRQVMNSESVTQLLNQEFDFMVGFSSATISGEVSTLTQAPGANVSQSLSVFIDRNQERRINVGSLLTTNELPLVGSAAANTDLRPQLVVNYATLN